MERARAAVSEFTNRHGHKTEVDETVNAPVTQEAIKPHLHEEHTQAIDREIHQEHHHTTIQPIAHTETLPEKHSHQMRDVEHHEFRHGDDEESRLRLEKERAQFRDTSTTHEHTQSSSQAPQVMGEHVHHHVHETVQPVINKETIAPEVVHTIQPIHETHHASAQHHGTSILPTKTLSDFTSGGGDLKGHTGTTVETYDGVPRSYNKAMQREQTDADINPGQMGVEGPGSHHTGGTGLSGTEPFTDKFEGHVVGQGHQSGTSGVGSGMTGHHHNKLGDSSGEYTSGDRLGGRAPDASGNYESGSGRTGGTDGLPSSNFNNSGASRYQESKEYMGDQGSGTSTQKKPSLMDKLNPMKDSNNDGQKGFMK